MAGAQSYLENSQLFSTSASIWGWAQSHQRTPLGFSGASICHPGKSMPGPSDDKMSGRPLPTTLCASAGLGE
ncbi:hypothetical protein Cadr_000004648 [Camelus dromedarius]|uniref:Uncharacterized protein n=1 Tax=Camelus dromedarius TaxID=9838 RepID=A0A5N4EC79_CAMDR|nr:hypothetical protein Cadr_000004648 [Camelus dromedarius]